MRNGKTLFYRAMAAEKLANKLDKKICLAIAEIFMTKVRELGYNPNNNYVDKSVKKI